MAGSTFFNFSILSDISEDTVLWNWLWVKETWIYGYENCCDFSWLKCCTWACAGFSDVKAATLCGTLRIVTCPPAAFRFALLAHQTHFLLELKQNIYKKTNCTMQWAIYTMCMYSRNIRAAQSLHVLPVQAYVLSRYSSFMPHFKNMHVRLIQYWPVKCALAV